MRWLAIHSLRQHGTVSLLYIVFAPAGANTIYGRLNRLGAKGLLRFGVWSQRRIAIASESAELGGKLDQLLVRIQADELDIGLDNQLAGPLDPLPEQPAVARRELERRDDIQHVAQAGGSSEANIQGVDDKIVAIRI